ncbi:hypothetical protein ACFFMM_18995 [Micromonospora chaiyaphumensis]|uniref:Uncharacterized protein n=1 Tax=Micromonospora chaiyaphumensis TaxID=307119 RepID=A0A1C4X4N9_9ACTN|nr:hypothetical protein [Micromonospora chaiyaphumensis]SCF03443.1 hypothetical protein GA0070214_105119 [Micromonospora chaiyaphumensis]
MLPIALTCPVWWVARWTARTLATLAVLVACSFGTATLPLGATASAAPAATASVEGPALRAAAVAPALRGDAADGPARPADEPEPGPVALVAVTRAVDRPVAAPAVAGRSLILAGLVPATVGSRAPPAR